MTTLRQDNEFVESILGTILEDSVEWIGNNMDPEDVFSESDLSYWAMEHGFIGED